jgi:hypothetical protein
MALAELSPKAAAESGVEITLYHPKTNLPLAERITIYGADSEVVKGVQRRLLNRRMERATRSRNNKSTVSAEENEAEGLELVVAGVKSWRTIMPKKEDEPEQSRPQIELAVGEWLDCTPENIKRVFERLPWMKEQVDQGIADRANFLQD